jgi:hypothetical protein
VIDVAGIVFPAVNPEGGVVTKTLSCGPLREIAQRAAFLSAISSWSSYPSIVVVWSGSIAKSTACVGRKLSWHARADGQMLPSQLVGVLVTDELWGQPAAGATISLAISVPVEASQVVLLR